jgi:hypothetical protein
VTERALRDPHHALADEARAAWVAEARERRQSLVVTATATATFTGALRDLAERQSPVQIDTTAGRRHCGSIVGVALDHLVIRDRTGLKILVPHAAVSSVRLRGELGPRPATGSRRPAQDRLLAEQLDRLGEHAEPVRLQLFGRGQVIAGRILGVGEDVVSLQLESVGTVVYLPISAIEAVIAGTAS